MRRAERKAETRSLVLQSALDLFVERGYEATSIADIALRAGVAQGTVFLVAPSKEALVVAAFDEKIAGVLESAIATIPRGRPMLEQLDHLFGALFDFYDAHRAISRILVRNLILLEQDQPRADHSRILVRFLGAIEEVLRTAPDHPMLRRDVDPTDVMANCFAVFLSFVIALLNGLYPSREPHGVAFRRQLRLSLEGALARPPERRASGRQRLQ